MKLHKQIIQDLIDPLTKNHVDRTIKTRVILNLGVHTFTDRQVKKVWVYEKKAETKWKKLMFERDLNMDHDLILTKLPLTVRFKTTSYDKNWKWISLNFSFITMDMFQPDNLDTQQYRLITELGHTFLQHRAKLASVVVQKSMKYSLKDGTQIYSSTFSSSRIG